MILIRKTYSESDDTEKKEKAAKLGKAAGASLLGLGGLTYGGGKVLDHLHKYAESGKAKPEHVKKLLHTAPKEAIKGAKSTGKLGMAAGALALGAGLALDHKVKKDKKKNDNSKD